MGYIQKHRGKYRARFADPLGKVRCPSARAAPRAWVWLAESARGFTSFPAAAVDVAEVWCAFVPWAPLRFATSPVHAPVARRTDAPRPRIPGGCPCEMR
jgi:hypothetical protein